LRFARVNSGKDTKPEISKSKSEFSEEDVEERIYSKVEFYNQHQGASEYKNDIENLVKTKGLDREDAMKLVLAQKAPEKLVDPAYFNKKDAGSTSRDQTL